MSEVLNRFNGTTIDRRDSSEVDRIVANHAQFIELLRSGRIAGQVGATAAPTGGTWKQGDFVRNTAPTEAGSAASKYVVLGWSCIADGTPGTWVACRCLTGN